MEEILVLIKILQTTKEPGKFLRSFYTSVSNLKIGDETKNEVFTSQILPKMYALYDKGIVEKDMVYLHLIATENFPVLNKIKEYEIANFSLKLSSPVSLYDYCCYKRNHWFIEPITNNGLIEDVFSKRIHNIVRLIKLVQLTNDKFACSEIKKLLPWIDMNDLDEFWKSYIQEIEERLAVIECCNIHDYKLNDRNIFNYMEEHSPLGTLSNFLQLSKVSYDSLNGFIMDLEKESTKESEVYQAFIILSRILSIFKVCNDPNLKTKRFHEIIDESRSLLLGVKNDKLLLELLENIFAMLFVKYKDFNSEEKSDKFRCEEAEIRTIIYLLRSVFDELRVKNIYARDTEEHQRFWNLHKYLSDALWRLDLITSVKKSDKIRSNLLRYMLANPPGLIRMCLNTDNFVRAKQVVEIFSLQESDIANEMEYTQKLKILVEKLLKLADGFYGDNGESFLAPMEGVVNKFFTEYPILPNQGHELIINQYKQHYPFLTLFDDKCQMFMNLLDLAIACRISPEECDAFLHILNDNEPEETSNSNYIFFYGRLLDIYAELKDSDVTIAELLLSPDVPMNLLVYQKREAFYCHMFNLYEQFMSELNNKGAGTLNNAHPTHSILIKMNLQCANYVEQSAERRENTKYLLKLFNYLKAFSKIFYIEENTSDLISRGNNTSYFELLNFNRSELMGKLLFQKNLDPDEFERYFIKLKLDFLYHIVGNCFPTINLHTEEFVTEDELYPEHSLYRPSDNIIRYILKRNWLLAFILKEMHYVEDVAIDVSANRIQTFLNYKALSKIRHLKPLYLNNEIITALQNEINLKKVHTYVNNQIFRAQDFPVSSRMSTNSDYSLENAQEIEEDDFRSTNWRELFHIIDVIPENQSKKSELLRKLKDMILTNLVNDRFETDYFRYVRYITNHELRVETIVNNLRNLPSDFCLDVIKAELSRFSNTGHSRHHQLEFYLKEIELCEKLKEILNLPRWSKCSEIVCGNMQEVLEKLVAEKNIDILIELLDLHKPNEHSLFAIDEDYFAAMFSLNVEFAKIQYLLNYLPYRRSMNICTKLLRMLKRAEHLQFVVDYMSHNSKQNDLLKNIRISLKMLSHFGRNEQDQLLCLIDEPLHIIEVLVMNTKLDKLSSVLGCLKDEISRTGYENGLSIEKIDQLLRTYAEKSLDFRVITQPNPRLLRTPEHKLMQSIDSFGSDKRPFVMPDVVPDKEEWVPNSEVLECMCCQRVIFSMFNRRHHCRRCGRVICYNCSLKRMLVPSYGDLMVRVCSDCFEQTIGGDDAANRSDSASFRSIDNDYWLLTNDEDHNMILRDEFSYEYAPSVSLCLSLLKYHSKIPEYPRFLLEQCDVLLQLLHPAQEPFQEIDYMLVIKMLKSLASAAKMLSSECALPFGSSSAERILTQAELLGLLAERGCLSLLPISNATQVPYIDAVALRRLRDKLLEREQWNLALEVSTKAGLDNTGVFAAWGKSCLKAGCLLMAREKFQRCLDKNGHYDALSESIPRIEIAEEKSESSGRSRYPSRSSSYSILAESKPTKNSPLLNEIVQILESNTGVMRVIGDVQGDGSSNYPSVFNQRDGAVCILSKLRNLKKVAAGIYGSSENLIEEDVDRESRQLQGPKIDGTSYEECAYYLDRYGTNISLIEFYVRHGEIDKALRLIVDNKLSTDVFVDIYLQCLKDGVANLIQEHMSKIDSTLDLWKEHLRHLCRHLEKHNLLNSLYQLQKFMGDYIRAAMTCIRFYQENVTSFTELSMRVPFLVQAEQHLKEVYEQEQWVEVASVRKTSAESTSRETFEEKAITNPSLVMKIDLKIIDKHIRTIWLQNDVVKFLTELESAGTKPAILLENILPPEDASVRQEKPPIPTLFGSYLDKIRLAVLCIVASANIAEGFQIATRIIEDFKLKPVKVYCQAGKHLAKAEQFEEIVHLVNCIKGSAGNDKSLTDMCDEMLTLAVATLSKANASGTKVEDLIKLISDKATKVSAYIETKQLKTAYFLAIRYKRMSDIRRILREAELNNQPNIKALCQRVLQSHSQSPTQPKE